MSDTPENLAAVLAEMRKANYGVLSATLKEYADRIEAAAAIDRDKARIEARSDEMERATAALEKAIAPGNAAAMREALMEIDEAVWNVGRTSAGEKEAHRIATAALAAPARNVDTVKSLDDFLSAKYQDDMSLDMIKKWREDEVAFELRHPGEAALLHNLRWLFLPAEGGAE